MTLPSLDARQERLLRDLAPQVLGAVIRRFRDFSASEDAVQEALIAAAAQWPAGGEPDDPRAWLHQVASRRIADHVRGETARRRREAIVVSLVPPEQQIALAADDDDTPAEHDDTLVLLFYGLLKRMSDNPMVALSDAVATAMVHGPAAGLTLLDGLDADARLRGHHRLDAVRAHLLERAGDREGAMECYRKAAGKTSSAPERDYLTTQAARLSDAGS